MGDKDHKGVVAEIKGATPDIEGLELTAPPEITLVIVARQRQILRNSAVQLNLSMTLSRKRHAFDEVRNLGKSLDQFVRDIAELDTLYPDAKKTMEDLDARAIAEGRL